MEQRVTHDGPDAESKPAAKRSTLDLVRSISSDTVSLVRKEVELARQELTEAVTARLKAAGAMGAAGMMALFALGFLGLAAVAGLDNVVRPWAARLIVAGAYLLIAGVAGAFAMIRMKRPPLNPEETRRTVKEDVEWARTQLRR